MKHVLVTTDSTKRGVFFGKLKSKKGDSVVLEGAKNVVYWCNQVHGVFGLAAKGPVQGCKIGPAVPSVELSGVTSVTECSPEAVEAFGKEWWT